MVSCCRRQQPRRDNLQLLSRMRVLFLGFVPVLLLLSAVGASDASPPILVLLPPSASASSTIAALRAGLGCDIVDRTACATAGLCATLLLYADNTTAHKHTAITAASVDSDVAMAAVLRTFAAAHPDGGILLEAVTGAQARIALGAGLLPHGSPQVSFAAIDDAYGASFASGANEEETSSSAPELSMAFAGLGIERPPLVRVRITALQRAWAVMKLALAKDAHSVTILREAGDDNGLALAARLERLAYTEARKSGSTSPIAVHEIALQLNLAEGRVDLDTVPETLDSGLIVLDMAPRTSVDVLTLFAERGFVHTLR